MVLRSIWWNRITGDRAPLAVLLVVGLSMTCPPAANPRVTVDWGAVRQDIDGFGASSANFVAPLPERVMDFFYTTQGIGLSLLRVQVYPDVASCEADKDPGGECARSTNATVLTGELATAKQAVARGANVWAAQWSPPAAMKENRSYMRGGKFVATPANYTHLARALAGFVTEMRGHGVPILALSPQNEPDMSTGYSSATWTPRQIHDFVPVLASALESAGAGTTKIMIAEESQWGAFVYATPAMNDPAVAAKIGIVAAHNYDQRNPIGRPRFSNWTDQRLWQTEASALTAYDGGMTNALMWAERIHAFFSEARVNAFHYWYLSAVPNSRRSDEALTNANGDVPRRTYAIGNWSKFVRPGWHEVDVPRQASLLVTAFQSAVRDEAAIVVVNKRSNDVTATFEIGSAIASSVTPWMTSRDHALAPQAALPVTNGTFTYVVPAESVVTFVGSATPQH